MSYTFDVDIDECAQGTNACVQRCSNTPGSYTCFCDDNFTLAPNGRSCTADPVACGGRLTAPRGSFQTEGWPTSYPQDDFQCVWIIALPDNGATIEFTIDQSAYGINGRPPCSSDHIEFFDGASSDDASLEKICGTRSVYRNTYPPTITTSTSEAKVVFTGSRNSGRPASRVGVKVNYRTIPTEQGTHIHNKQMSHLPIAQSNRHTCNMYYLS